MEGGGVQGVWVISEGDSSSLSPWRKGWEKGKKRREKAKNDIKITIPVFKIHLNKVNVWARKSSFSQFKRKMNSIHCINQGLGFLWGS